MSPDRIKKMRNDLELTQESLAEALGVAKLTISQYETGYRRPNKTVLILFVILESFSKKKALDLINEFRKISQRIKKDENEE